jgi:hypothetical protein
VYCAMQTESLNVIQVNISVERFKIIIFCVYE